MFFIQAILFALSYITGGLAWAIAKDSFGTFSPSLAILPTPRNGALPFGHQAFSSFQSYPGGYYVYCEPRKDLDFFATILTIEIERRSLSMEKTRILGISGSPRKGNTEYLVRLALEAAESVGNIATKFVSLREKPIKPCLADYGCYKKGSVEVPCPTITDDYGNEVMAMMAKADGLIVGAPVYFGCVTAQMKALMDRSMALSAKAMALRNKVAGVLTVAHARNGGQEHTLFDMIRWLMLHDMIVVSVGADRPEKSVGCYWGGSCTQGFPYPKASPTNAGKKGAQEDVIGINSVRSVAKRVAEMTKIMKAGISAVPESELAWPLHPTHEMHALYRGTNTK